MCTVYLCALHLLASVYTCVSSVRAGVCVFKCLQESVLMFVCACTRVSHTCMNTACLAEACIDPAPIVHMPPMQAADAAGRAL